MSVSHIFGGSGRSADLKAVTVADTARGGAGHLMHRTFELNPRVEMTALSDPDEEGRAKLAAECGAAATYADYRTMLEREKPDIAVIARHWFDDGRVDEFLAALHSGVRGLLLIRLTHHHTTCGRWSVGAGWRVRGATERLPSERVAG